MKNQKFLTSVAKKLLKETKPIHQLALVLPNQRAGLFLKQEIAALVKKPVFLPKIITIEEFFHQLSGLTKVEKVEQLFRLYESHQHVAVKDADDFDKFLTWAPTFLSDCGEIDTNLIDGDVFFKTLYNDREIRNWNVAEQITELQEKYLQFWYTAKDLYNHFTNNLLHDGRAYNGLAYRYAIENIQSAYAKLPYSAVWMVGFNALNKAEEALFQFIYENNAGRFFWDMDDYYVNDSEEMNKAGKYFREYRKLWLKDTDLQTSHNKIGTLTETINIIESANDVLQCDIAANIIEELAQKGEVNANTAIVLADEQLLEPLLYRLPKEFGPYNITMGKALAQFPLFHLFDDYFALQNGLISGNKGAGFPTSLLKPLLTSPYLKLGGNLLQQTQLLSTIVEQNISLLWSQEFNQQVDDEVWWKEFLQPVGSLDEMITSLHVMIEQLRNQFLSQDDKINIQVLFEIKKIIQQFETYLHQFQGEWSLKAFRNLFKQVARSTRIPYEGEPLQGIQIMGVLETRCLDFENIIILSTNEDIIPKGQTGNSFIPYVFKDHFQIQTFKDKDAIYAYTFYRLLHFAKRVYFVYNGQPGAIGGGEVSRFVQQIDAELPQKIKKEIPIIHQSVSLPEYMKPDFSYTIEKTDQLINEMINYMENEGLSPSSLNQIIQSPLDFYFQKIAGISEPKEWEQDIEVNTFGTIVHDSLEELYTPYKNIPLTKEILNGLLENTTDVVNEKVKKVFKKGDTSTGMNYLSKMAAQTLVEHTIKGDLLRIQQHRLTILSLEEELTCTFPKRVFGKTIEVKLKGKADRIQQRDEVIEIIDYKTGKVDAMQSSKVPEIHEKPKHAKLNQILCYSLMACEGKSNYALDIIRPAMQPLKSWQSGLVFINGDADFVISKQLMDEYKDQLQMVISKLLDTKQHFVPEEDEDRIKYSAYKGIYL